MSTKRDINEKIVKDNIVSKSMIKINSAIVRILKKIKNKILIFKVANNYYFHA